MRIDAISMQTSLQLLTSLEMEVDMNNLIELAKEKAGFHHGTATDQVTAASAQALSDGLRLTFMVAGGMVAAAGCMSLVSSRFSQRSEQASRMSKV